MRFFANIAMALLATLMLVACGRSDASDATTGMAEARGVTITRCDGYTIVEVANPWRKGEVLHTYIFVPRYADTARNSKETGEASGSTRHDDDGSASLKGREELPLPEGLPEGTVVRVPIERAVVYSSVHAGVMKELGAFSAVRGVCDAQYYTMPEVQSGLDDGSIADCGNSLSPTIERLVALKPDAIILSPFQNAGYGVLTNLGVPIIECADYMEHTPLGRAEWIKLFGELLCCREKADSIFQATADEYSALTALTATVEHRPKVISEMITSGVWFVPGGDSYMAHLFTDAGASYPWSDNNNSGSLSLDFSQVLARAQDADFWLIKPDRHLSYSDFEAINPLNVKFKAFGCRGVYQCVTSETSLFTDFPFHPQVLLRDFVKIFHPELLPDYQLRYYQPLSND
ncbi:MAG: ABC transporter substrate-binding protein [Bacteroidales bacterium]|nr:ABC transporter substrate-binding protein [Bacteroidales bacterium]